MVSVFVSVFVSIFVSLFVSDQQIFATNIMLRRGGRPLVVDAKWLQRKKRILQMKSKEIKFMIEEVNKKLRI